MSSETSTERVRTRARATRGGSAQQRRSDRLRDDELQYLDGPFQVAIPHELPQQRQGRRPEDQPLQPWQFFVLASLGCATAATFMARGQGVMAVVLLATLMAAAAFVGLTALRAVAPLVSNHHDRTAMIGHRTRAALEREKMLALRAIKELEFDRAMGKLSEQDWADMSGRLRARAVRLMRRLDAGAGYREQIERDVARRMSPGQDRVASGEGTERGDHGAKAATAEAEKTSVDGVAAPICTVCSTTNDPDARFCKNCGQKL
jgi:hypothetical protein